MIKAFGEVREYDLTTSIEQIKNIMAFADDYEVIEYKEVLCEQ